MGNLDLAEKINDVDFGDEDENEDDEGEDDLMGMYNDLLDGDDNGLANAA